MDITRSRNVSVAHAHSLSAALRVDHHGDALAFHIERTTPHGSVTLQFENEVFVNSLRYESAVHVLCDISWSEDGKHFYRVHGLKHESHGESRDYRFPLVSAKFLQLNFYQEGGPIHKCDIRKLVLGFTALVKLSASTNLDRLWTVENLIDRRDDYGWASLQHERNEPDHVLLDLGDLFFVSGVQIKSVAEEYNFFPVRFQLQLSSDGGVWQTVQSEDHFMAASGAWYAWRFPQVRSRYLRIQIDKHAHYRKGEYQSKLLDVAVIAVADSIQSVVSNASSTHRMASENVPGMVLLAGNNIATAGRVVQSDDARLRNASTEYRGIIQFARDNEVTQERAVQSNDSRLQAATELAPGIVQLAKSGEARAEAVVQGNDARLKSASPESPGIVQLAKDGETRGGVALQASDARLKSATTEAHGITILAKDGEQASGKAVQGNDARLRLATQAWPGIVQLAGHSEIAGNKAVLADDPRLQDADESRKGRMQFARKNEVADLKAVQASDPRLQNATEEGKGIVQFARDGHSVSGQAVQASDTRLTDARTAKPHTHSEYALVQHDFASHGGNLRIQCSSSVPSPGGIAAPVDTNTPFVVENAQGIAAHMVGGTILAAEGTASYHFGKNGPAIVASSREQPAATLISANAYALHLPKSFQDLKGSDKSLHAEGLVQLDGQVTMRGGACISVALPKASSEAFVDGDLLTVENGVASKMRSENQVLVGVAVKSAGLQLEGGPVSIRAAVAGVISLRVHGLVKAGDKLCLNTGQAGTCKVAQGQEKIIAVALESATSDREKQVLSVLVR
jgi:hypothetical protein